MLRDTTWLREQLLLALALVPLIGSGCGDSEAQPRPNPRPMPSCPSGDFCAPAATVKPLAKPDATLDHGCPSNLKEHYDTTPPDKLPRFSYATFDLTATLQTRRTTKTDDCCYHWMLSCPGGRPLLDDTSPIVANVREGAVHEPRDLLDPDVRAALVECWLADALAEHASVASFARATLELMAVGAPAELVAETQRASLDELEHARAVFAIASRYAGRALEPGPLPLVPPRAGGIARVAHDVFVEGCVGETVAALCVARAAAACDDAELAATLRAIADDEARHAALAWKTLAWTIAADPRVLATIHDVARELRDPAPIPDADEDAAILAAHGRLDRRGLALARRDAWHDVIAPMLAELA